MRTIPCCFTVFLATISPAAPVIYSLRFAIAFKFWAFIFCHLVPVTKINLYQGVVSDSWTVKLLKMGSHSK